MSTDSTVNKSTNGRNASGPSPAQLRVLRGGFALGSKVSAALAARAALALFLRPRRHRRPPREAEVLSSALPLLEPAGVAAWQWGVGPVILLVHGWEGRGAQLGAFVAPLVEAGFRVVAFDAPAHGASPGSSATIIDFAAAIERVAAQVGPIFGVIAHSFGCAGATVAMARGLEVQAAVFVAPPMRLLDGAGAFADALALTPEVREELWRQLEARVGASVESLDLAQLAARQRAALLVLHDHEDREIPWERGAELAAVWPEARLLSTRGLGHRRILRASAVIEAAVEVFEELDAHRPRSELDRALDHVLH